ncbi:MAG: GGDEF domain-containing protein [Actinomycetia bacterium]|nr:GGDEF domain-containing protein [Actinomycetes bacterium]
MTAVAMAGLWGMVAGTQVVALAEFGDLTERPAAHRAAVAWSLVPPVVLVLDGVGLGAPLPGPLWVLAYLVAWWRAAEGSLADARGGVGTPGWAGLGPLRAAARRLGSRIGLALAPPGRMGVWVTAACAGALGWEAARWAVQPSAGPAVAAVLGFTVVAAPYGFRHDGRRRYWLEQARRAEHDGLTDLLTRHGLWAWRERLGPAAGLILALDLDEFKNVNDTYGHDAGDAVLVEFARRVRGQVRATDAVVRPGGDEITVWMPGIDRATAPLLARSLFEAAGGAPYPLAQGSVALSVSVGWAVGPLDEATAREADRALLAAKRAGKNQLRAAWAGDAAAIGDEAPATGEGDAAGGAAAGPPGAEAAPGPGAGARSGAGGRRPPAAGPRAARAITGVRMRRAARRMPASRP